MIFVPVDFLKEGMILAQDVNFEIGGMSLLTKGQVLKANYIEKLQAMNIVGVYVESKMSADIEINQILTEKLKKDVLVSVKNIFNDFSRSNKLTVGAVGTIKNIAQKLVSDILSKEKILINLIELKGHDDYTYQHSLSVAVLAVAIGVKLGLNEENLNNLALSGLLHDIGKVSVPKEILNKPSKLTAEEFEVVKKHPEDGFLKLKKSNMCSVVTLMGIESHHEKVNGKGYPKKLKGNQIPFFGRILAVADVYDALTSDRPYRKGSFPGEVIEYMMGNTEVHFDQEVLTAFLKSVAAYPAGMLVSLSDGRIALVIRNNEENTMRPVVRVFNEDGSQHSDIDLFHDRRYHNLTITGMGYGKEITNSSMMNNVCEINDFT